MLENKAKIRVLVRKRPLSKKEASRGETDIVTIQKQQTVLVREQKLKVDLTPYIDEYRYNFDAAYDHTVNNQYIYQTAVHPLVHSAFEGAKVTCFAYGQTGSGKTYTMLGDGQNIRGLYLLASEDIFKQTEGKGFEVWLSFYEIYCGKLLDLLNDKNILFAREDSHNNVHIVGLREIKVHSSNELMDIIGLGTAARVTSQNGTNNDSSRSHAILQIVLKKKGKSFGKLSFIDLAGSERAADHADQLQKQTRIDGAEINKSLLALKECIRALDQNKHHTPFRGSKLTMVLKDSFTGFCRTVMIGNVAPNSGSAQDTLNTLKYADRVKELKKTREQPNYDKFQQLQNQLLLPRQLPQPKPATIPLHQRENHKPHYNILKNNSQGVPKIRSRTSQIQNIVSAVNSANNAVNLNINNWVQGSQSAPKIKSKDLPGMQKQFKNVQVEKEIMLMGDVSEQQMYNLSEKHDQYIQLILEQQEKLIRSHQLHINQTIELTKKQMILRNEADKIGSNIEDYLDNLDQLLTQKSTSLLVLQKKIRQIKGYLHQSRKIEQQYAQLEHQIYTQQEEPIDDQQLFV